MLDDFENYESSLTAPATSAWAISPSDTLEMPRATRGIYIGQPGDVMIQMVSGDIVSFPNMQPGVVYALRAIKVFATGTTAMGLVGVC